MDETMVATLKNLNAYIDTLNTQYDDLLKRCLNAEGIRDMYRDMYNKVKLELDTLKAKEAAG